jgi:hypothetical protein
VPDLVMLTHRFANDCSYFPLSQRSANASPAGRDTVGTDPSSGERAPIAITMDSDSINESINQSDEGETRELS